MKLNDKFRELIEDGLRKELEEHRKITATPWYFRRPWVYVEIIILGALGSLTATYSFEITTFILQLMT